MSELRALFLERFLDLDQVLLGAATRNQNRIRGLERSRI
jgi:hypothetical protein